MLEALLPHSKPSKKPSRSKMPIRKLPPKVSVRDMDRGESARSRLSFFGEVEKFLQKKAALDEDSEDGSFLGSGYKPEDSAAESGKLNAGSTHAPQKSIFDVFKVPERAHTRSQNAFETEAWDAYESTSKVFFNELSVSSMKSSSSALTTVQKESVESWLLLNEPKVQVKLPILAAICERGIENTLELSLHESLKNQVIEELGKQEQKFRKELEWSANHYKYAAELIHAFMQFSNENHNVLPIVILWEKMKEAGYMKRRTIEVGLRFVNGFSGGILSRSRLSLLTVSPRTRLLDMLNSKDKNQETESAPKGKQDHRHSNVPEQIAWANDLLYKPTVQSSAIRTRRLISLGDATNALKLIEERLTGESKLLAYSQVFSLFLELGDIRSALVLMKKMKKGHKKVRLEPEQFVQLIAATAEEGYFCHGSDPIGSIDELGYSETSGYAFFDQLATEMSSYADSISSASAKRLQKAFQRGFNNSRFLEESDVSALAQLTPLVSAENTKVVADRVSIDSSNGYCVLSGIRLSVIELESSQRRQMKNCLLKLGNDRHVEAMNLFWDWLDTRTGRPFTVIVDGANIAYYMQNFDGGGFNFRQIQFVLTALESNGEFPLVILPHKYLGESFRVTLGNTTKFQVLTSADRSIIYGLEDTGKLYSVPQGCLDDYFWISATLSDQANCRTDDAYSNHCTNKRLSSGAQPVVITNDQIRDHKEYEPLQSKAFYRWCTNTIVNYDFTGFVGDECIDPEITFTPAYKFSREIQSNQPGTWHFPVQDWEASDWFCIRIPSPS